ncbi:MAG: carboxypeptidase regulatory-like domain-containing protein, partial [Bacteroidota bacterium]
LIYDIASNPGSADFVAFAPNIYAHDVYVQDGRMYASEINIGRLAIYDVSDPRDVTFIGERETPFAFTHNAWTTADGNYVFTTDERADAPVAAYDISDPSAPVLIDEFRPGRSVGSSVIPHNVHVLNEYLAISYYTDGLEIVDVSVPDNGIEVAYYDTWLGGDGGFNGSWGAYPFLPSGLVLATDIANGLFVIEVDYKRGARLKGLISDADLGTPLNDVTVTLSSPENANTATDAAGLYATGVADAGDFQATFSKVGFNDLTVPVTLENGVEVVLDTSLQSSTPRFSVSGSVIEAGTNDGIEGTEVILVGQSETYSVFADQDGVFTLPLVFEGDYQIYAAKWGYRNREIANFTINSFTAELTIELERGFLDGFVIDQGWTASGNASTGSWERGIPNGTVFEGQFSNPNSDVNTPTDIGEQAYVTGNLDTDAVGADDIDDGFVVLTSPFFDATSLVNPVLSYQYWFFNDGGDPPANDQMTVVLSNGVQDVTLAAYNETTAGWQLDSFILAEHITLTNNMQLTVTSGDQGGGHLVEAGFDDFEIRGALVSSVEDIAAGVEAATFPNPAGDNENFNITYELPITPVRAVTLEVTDVAGRVVARRSLPQVQIGNVAIGAEWPAGSYFARIIADGQSMYSTKLLKQ